MKTIIKFVLTLFCLAGFFPLTASALNLPVAGDAYSVNSTGLKNMATIKVSPLPQNSKSLLKFDLAAIPAGTTANDIGKATLFIYVNAVTTTGNVQITPINSDWNENVPSIIPTLGTATVTYSGQLIDTKNKYYAFDVTGLVKNWLSPTANFGLAIEPMGATLTSFSMDSKEATLTSHPAFIEVALTSGTTTVVNKPTISFLSTEAISTSASDNKYMAVNSLYALSTAGASLPDKEVLVPIDCVFTNAKGKLDTGGNIKAILVVNGFDKPEYECNFNGGTTCTGSGTGISVKAGDLIAWKLINSGFPSSYYFYLSATCQ